MIARLRELLACRQKQHILDPDKKPAAVLVPIFLSQGEYHVLFTRRTDTVRTHKRQMSFPGGTPRKDETNPASTALREAREEIGLREEDVTVIGELDDQPSVASDYIITPVVGLIPWPYRLSLNKHEVKEILTMPIASLLDGSCLVREVRRGEVVTSYLCGGNLVWGATARILGQLLELLSLAEHPDKGETTGRAACSPH